MGFFKEFNNDLFQVVTDEIPNDNLDDELESLDKKLDVTPVSMEKSTNKNKKKEKLQEKEEKKMERFVHNEIKDIKLNDIDLSVVNNDLDKKEVKTGTEEEFNKLHNIAKMKFDTMIEKEKSKEEEKKTELISTDIKKNDEKNKEEDLMQNVIEKTKVGNNTTEELAKKEKSINQVEEKQCTVIGKDTKITGNISSEGPIEIAGMVTGDIECDGKLTINGVVKGNSMAADVEINAKRLEGNVSSEGNIYIGKGTVLIGDINATEGNIAGAVKGEIDVNGSVILESSAIVKGNIKAKSVQISNGAVVDGYCSLTYAQVNIEDIFGESEKKESTKK